MKTRLRLKLLKKQPDPYSEFLELVDVATRHCKRAMKKEYKKYVYRPVEFKRPKTPLYDCPCICLSSSTYIPYVMLRILSRKVLTSRNLELNLRSLVKDSFFCRYRRFLFGYSCDIIFELFQVSNPSFFLLILLILHRRYCVFQDDIVFRKKK